jgi:hypothetical protein
VSAGSLRSLRSLESGAVEAIPHQQPDRRSETYAPGRWWDSVLSRDGLADGLSVVGNAWRGQRERWRDGLCCGRVDARGILRGAGAVAKRSGLELEGLLGEV